ncbi:ATP-grasp domain-containing protein [Aquamicrobium sp. LC103]|uniref:ATP-grasp domain-containing protein n=1 Tax=Aquamicrobium sp. LC103 TaxID=1120658 RepID=UPI001FED490E|nr:ATP-grasp domain-containing protein [Aquamicrobium sp. LC103]
MHEKSSHKARPLLIAAISGRALAAAARRAGYRPLVADFFRDTDTVAIAEKAVRVPGSMQAGFEQASLIEALDELAGDEPPVAVVCGSGFERRPEIVDEIARRYPLAGNSASTIRRIKDPHLFAADCAELGIPHPEHRWERPADPESWVSKQAGAAGGGHIRRADSGEDLPGIYFQRFVAGESISALFIGDGRNASIVGFSRQWTAPTPQTPYRYGGAVRLRRFNRHEAALIESWLSGLTRRAGLVGLCSADFIRSRGSYRLVEINPRPGATLDIFDSEAAPLIEAHLQASRSAPHALPRFRDCMASIIVYADKPVERFPSFSWPEWAADHQSPGTTLSAGDPICTAFASGRSALAAQRAVRDRAREIEHRVEGART